MLLVLSFLASLAVNAPPSPRVVWAGHSTASLEADVDRAIELVAAFARAHHLGSVRQRKALRVEVFDSRPSLWRRYAQLVNSPNLPMPERDPSGLTFGDETLLVLSPDEYSKRSMVGRSTDHAWARLVAHELTHLFHRDVVGPLDVELAPQWFIEGIAVIAAGQEFGISVNANSASDALRLTKAEGELAYASYAAAVRYFAAKAKLAELMKLASDAGFNSWLQTL